MDTVVLTPSTAKAVAKQLRSYMKKEARENGFDTSVSGQVGSFSHSTGASAHYQSLLERDYQNYQFNPVMTRHIKHTSTLKQSGKGNSNSVNSIPDGQVVELLNSSTPLELKEKRMVGTVSSIISAGRLQAMETSQLSQSIPPTPLWSPDATRPSSPTPPSSVSIPSPSTSSSSSSLSSSHLSQSHHSHPKGQSPTGRKSAFRTLPSNNGPTLSSAHSKSDAIDHQLIEAVSRLSPLRTDVNSLTEVSTESEGDAATKNSVGEGAESIAVCKASEAVTNRPRDGRSTTLKNDDSLQTLTTGRPPSVCTRSTQTANDKCVQVALDQRVSVGVATVVVNELAVQTVPEDVEQGIQTDQSYLLSQQSETDGALQSTKSCSSTCLTENNERSRQFCSGDRGSDTVAVNGRDLCKVSSNHSLIIPQSEDCLQGELTTVTNSSADNLTHNPSRCREFLEACRGGNLSVIKQVLGTEELRGACGECSEFSGIHCAAVNGQVEALQVLLKAGYDPNQTSSSGRTALHYAAMSDNVNGCKVLLEAGCNSFTS